MDTGARGQCGEYLGGRGLPVSVVVALCHMWGDRGGARRNGEMVRVYPPMCREIAEC